MPGIRKPRRRDLGSVALGLVMISACARSAPPDSLVIHDVTVVDVEHGRLVPHQDVVISGGRIRRVARAASQPPAGTRVVEGAGQFLIPGLWDAHVHALWDPEVRRRFLPRFVAHGVTGIRDMGGTLAELAAARREADSLSPRVVAAGVILDGPEPVDPSVSWPLRTPEDARLAVDSLAALGADFLKVYTLVRRPAYVALAEAARARGIPLAGHLPAEITAIEAAASGQRTIEHLREEIAPLCAPADSAACAPILDALAHAPVWQTPTLVVVRAKAYPEDAWAAHAGLLPALPAVVRDMWAASLASRRRNPSALERYTDVARLTARMHRAGVPILAGTDAGVFAAHPGISLHDELQLLVDAGLSPAAALRAATLEPARMLGATDSMGTVARGRVADLVLLAANPLEQIGNTRRVSGVFLRGRYLSRAILDSLAAN